MTDAAFDAEIRNLVGTYCHETTTGNVDRWAATWAEHAVWSIPGAGVIEGRDLIRSIFASIRSQYMCCIQELLSGTIEIENDSSARALWYVRELQWSRSAEGATTGSELVGLYEDVIERRPGCPPQFASRNFRLLYSGPVSLGGRFHAVAHEIVETLGTAYDVHGVP